MPSRSLVAGVAVFTLFASMTTGGAAAAAHRTYYVSQSGADDRPGTAAQPFQHIQQCADVMAPGDTCVIASGTYRETVTPARSGTDRAPITFTAAPGATVTVDGTDVVSGWSQVTAADLAQLQAADARIAGSPFASGVSSGHVYQAPVALSADLPGNQVFVDGAMNVEAQWPYPGNNPIRPNWANAQSGTSTSLSDNALTQPAGWWVGTRLTARNWFVAESGTVTSSAVGSVTADSLTDCISLQPNQTTFYALSGALRLLGHGGSWFYDPAAKKLYLWTLDGDNPASHLVEAKQRNVGIDLSGRSFIAISGLGVRASTVQTSPTSTDNTIDRLAGRFISAYADLKRDPNMVTVPDHCAMLSAGETTSGILLNGTRNTLRNSTLDWSAGNGVMVAGSKNTVTGNTITHTDYLGSYAAGINVIGQEATITHNTVTATGRSSINIDNKVAGAFSRSHDIGYNDLSDYNNLVNDGGAIYVCCRNDIAGTSMHHNLMHDPAPLARFAPAPGIYMDLGASNGLIYNNVVWNNTTYGAVLFNTETSGTGTKVYNNTSGTDTNVVSLHGGPYTNMEFANNIGNVDTQPGITASNNIPFSTDPLFTSPAVNDYTLQANSPARNAGVVRPPATDGFRDKRPSAGAYQYGVPRWFGGASLDSTTVQAERYASSNGVARHAAGTGMVMGNFDGGDWAGYTAVDFGTGRDTFAASLGEDPAYAGRQFHIRLDSPTGPVIGTVTSISTGGFDTYETQYTPIVPTGGVHDVYLVALGSSPGVANLDYFSFTRTR
ncbi:carbohydrate-binding protein [Actinocrispum sp. NPDC049592]|uniref:carbohydrate-binding protein n=1 Tax=Actinocrispum sp. NPDC049592 TaxID=3154835 RepID=UPI0034317E08